MSMSTVAATFAPETQAPVLPASRPEKFLRSDFIAAGIVAFITLAVYIVTLAPNVTLEDSGELITGATKFGVPHPPGYPLWTMAGFVLSHILPIGSLAWRINLLSALIGAVANALLTLLVCHSGRWLLQRWVPDDLQSRLRPMAFYAGILSGLTIGFSDVMWGQAVISAVHGTLNAFFVICVLFAFYLWMLEPAKTNRLIYAVFVFALGLTNHHTLIQVIPAILLATFLLRVGKFWSVFLSVNLFSLSILIYLSWLSNDPELFIIGYRMAVILLAMTAAVSFYYLKRFNWRLFLAGAGVAVAVFAYGHYIMGPSQFDTLRFDWAHLEGRWYLWGSFVHPGWLQMTTGWGFSLLLLCVLALGLLFSSSLELRMIIGVFAAGWVGLSPYAYESFASSTHPPMNWGYTKERAGFYYAVSRQQYPESLPNLIKSTIGKTIGTVPRAEQVDASIGRPEYFHRLWLTFYYYGLNLVGDFTVPVLLLGVALLLYARYNDWLQLNWLMFLVLAFFFVGFLLQVIEPQESFDFERNLQYKVFHLQSHCILAMFVGYGALAAMSFVWQEWPEAAEKLGVVGLGAPTLLLSLLPFWSNVTHDSQRDHWFGWYFGHDTVAPMDRNAVYFGGSDFGRFVPTFMAFVESQQDNYWKRDPNFDRRDVTVITQNALCDNFYCHYIRDQYDPRFRPKEFTAFEKWLGRDTAYPKIPVTCVSEEELAQCWEEYQKRPDVAARLAQGGPVIREGSSDVFDINGIVLWHIFQKNKASHTFYLEQSVAIPWTYPYLQPWGLIFKIMPDPMKALPADVVAKDRKYWDDYSARLLNDPNFRVDADATVTFGKLCAWHADLYHYWHMDAEEGHFLRMALSLCPQLADTVSNLSRLLAAHNRFDEAIALVKQAQADDPRNEMYDPMMNGLLVAQSLAGQEKDIRAQLNKTAKSPYDLNLNLQLAQLLQAEGRRPELMDRLHFVAGLTNWNQQAMAGVVQYYVDHMHDPEAAIAFLEARAAIDPKASEMIYNLAALHATLNHHDAAMKYLAQAAATGGTNALISAKVDPRFAGYRTDPAFEAIVNAKPSPPQINAAPKNPTPPKKAAKKPARKHQDFR